MLPDFSSVSPENTPAWFFGFLLFICPTENQSSDKPQRAKWPGWYPSSAFSGAFEQQVHTECFDLRESTECVGGLGKSPMVQRVSCTKVFCISLIVRRWFKVNRTLGFTPAWSDKYLENNISHPRKPIFVHLFSPLSLCFLFPCFLFFHVFSRFVIHL